jgi:hypothetical protein
MKYLFTLRCPFTKATDVFDSPRVLDAAHGQGCYDFTVWTPDPKHPGWKRRKGKVKSVEIPASCRALNGGKKSITCVVKQRYMEDMNPPKITVKSTMRPKLMGAPVPVKNCTWFTITPGEEDGTVSVEADICNTATFPPPWGTMAKVAMNDMSLTTLQELEAVFLNLDL